MRAALILSLVGALLLSATPGLADRPSDEVSVEARAHYERGLRLYTRKAFKQASVQLSLAYDIDPHPHVIYAWAQAERMAGNCLTALRLYREYMAFPLSAEASAAAEANLVRCQEILEEADELAHDDESDHEGVVESDHEGVVEHDQQRSSDLALVRVAPTLWYRDGLSIAFLTGAVLGTGVGIWAYSSALSVEDRAVDEPDDMKYETLRQQSADRRTTAAISAGVGALSLVLALVRIGTLPESNASKRQVQLAPNRSGTGFVLSARF